MQSFSAFVKRALVTGALLSGCAQPSLVTAQERIPRGTDFEAPADGWFLTDGQLAELQAEVARLDRQVELHRQKDSAQAVLDSLRRERSAEQDNLLSAQAGLLAEYDRRARPNLLETLQENGLAVAVGFGVCELAR